MRLACAGAGGSTDCSRSAPATGFAHKGARGPEGRRKKRHFCLILPNRNNKFVQPSHDEPLTAEPLFRALSMLRFALIDRYCVSSPKNFFQRAPNVWQEIAL